MKKKKNETRFLPPEDKKDDYGLKKKGIETQSLLNCSFLQTATKSYISSILSWEMRLLRVIAVANFPITIFCFSFILFYVSLTPAIISAM